MTTPDTVSRVDAVRAVPSTPSISMLAHNELLAQAFAKVRSAVPIPLSREEIDALVREISYVRAELLITQQLNERSAEVLEAFATSGVRLERIGGNNATAWAVQTDKGWTRGVSPWDAMQKATRIQSVATQLSKFADRLVSER